MYYYILPTDKDLQHHGILGMKWGVRRYQSYDTVPRKSGEGGKEIGDAKRTASKREINKYAKKLGKANAGINFWLMTQNRGLAVTERVAEKMLKKRRPDINGIANDRYITRLRNIWRSSDQFNAEKKYDKIFNKAYEKFDKISIDSITETQEKKYMEKANKYFNQSLAYRNEYVDLYEKNNKKINEIRSK